MKKTEIIMNIIGGLFMVFFFLMLKYAPVNEEKELSPDGLAELNHTRNTVSELAQSLDAKVWGYGGAKYVDEHKWMYVGAHIVLPKCIEYDAFEEALYKQGFNLSGHTADYCKKDVSISNISPEKDMVYGHDGNRKYLICGKTSFSISWKRGDHKDNPNCFGTP